MDAPTSNRRRRYCIIKVPSGTEVVTLRLKKRSNDFWLVVLEKKI